MCIPLMARGRGIFKVAYTNSAKSSGGNIIVSAPADHPVRTGDLVLEFFVDQVGGSAPTIAFNDGWTPTQMSGGPKTNTVRCTGWYGTATNPLVFTTSFSGGASFGTSSAARAVILAVFNRYYVGSKDKDITWINDSTTPFDCPSTGTLTQANEVVIGMVGTARNDALAAGSSDTLIAAINTTGGSAGSNVSVGMTYRQVAATTAVAPQMTGTSAAGCTGTISFNLG